MSKTTSSVENFLFVTDETKTAENVADYEQNVIRPNFLVALGNEDITSVAMEEPTFTLNAMCDQTVVETFKNEANALAF